MTFLNLIEKESPDEGGLGMKSRTVFSKELQALIC
jgi:hypothetical protein